MGLLVLVEDMLLYGIVQFRVLFLLLVLLFHLILQMGFVVQNLYLLLFLHIYFSFMFYFYFIHVIEGVWGRRPHYCAKVSTFALLI